MTASKASHRLPDHDDNQAQLHRSTAWWAVLARCCCCCFSCFCFCGCYCCLRTILPQRSPKIGGACCCSCDVAWTNFWQDHPPPDEFLYGLIDPSMDTISVHCFAVVRCRLLSVCSPQSTTHASRVADASSHWICSNLGALQVANESANNFCDVAGCRTMPDGWSSDFSFTPVPFTYRGHRH